MRLCPPYRLLPVQFRIATADAMLAEGRAAVAREVCEPQPLDVGLLRLAVLPPRFWWPFQFGKLLAQETHAPFLGGVERGHRAFVEFRCHLPILRQPRRVGHLQNVTVLCPSRPISTHRC